MVKWAVGTQSPTLNKAIGLGYVEIGNAAIDNVIYIEIRNNPVRAKVGEGAFCLIFSFKLILINISRSHIILLSLFCFLLLSCGKYVTETGNASFLW